MKSMFFTQAVDDALAQVMTEDPRVIVFGEDIPLLRRDLLVRFGPERVCYNHPPYYTDLLDWIVSKAFFKDNGDLP